MIFMLQPQPAAEPLRCKSIDGRAYLWQGKTAEAHSTAQSLLTDGEKWFPWTSPDAVNNPANPDRVFSPEIFFGA